VPEGDTIHRLAAKMAPLVGQTIEVLELPRKNVRPDAYAGRAITGVEARGKNLLIHVEGGVTLKSHLKMHGTWRLRAREKATEPRPSESDVVVFLVTPRFVAICCSAPIAELVRTRDLELARDAQARGGLGELGIDVLAEGFDVAEAARRWHRASHPTIAEALLDQRLVAGIGNEWKSELCFLAKVHPFSPPRDVPLAVLEKLATEAQVRMHKNVARKRRMYPIDRIRAEGRIARFEERRPGQGPLSVYGRGGEPCYDCRSPIERAVRGEPPRSTYWCPRCQPMPGDDRRA
jgi:endonuclease VIII